jgi:hypothetical protein
LLPKLDNYISQVWAAVSILYLVGRSDASTRGWASSIRQRIESSLPNVLEAAIDLKAEIDTHTHTKTGPIVVPPPKPRPADLK